MSQVIGIFTLPLVTRLYSPEEIGTVSLFLSFFGFWVATIALRYEQALMISEDDMESHIVHRLATIVVIVMSLTGTVLFWLLRYNNIFKFNILPFWTTLVAFPLFCFYGLYTVYRSWALRAGLVSLIGKTTILRSSVLAFSKLGFGLCGGGILGLFLSELTGAFSSLPNLILNVNRHFASSKPMTLGFTQLRAASLKYGKFTILETPSTWLDSLSMMLPLPMVASLYGAESAGWFSLARMAVSIPNAQIGAAVGDIFQMSLAESIRNKDFIRAREAIYSLATKMSLIGLIPLLGSVLFLPHLFPFVFGKNWEQAGLVSAILAFWMYAGFIVSPLSRALSVIQAQEWKLIYDFVVLALSISCYIAAKMLHLSLFQFSVLISMANILAYIIYAYLLYIMTEYRLEC